MTVARAIMIQGTASHVGKTLIAAALCAWLRRKELRVAPFKALNMSLNSAVTSDGLEISRSIAFQAAIAGVEPVVQMNPILLKPMSGRGCHVIAMGKAIGASSSHGSSEREHLVDWAVPLIASSVEELRSQFDVIVIEGAGGCAEVNLRDTDVANMRTADIADAPVLLVGDIDRGGVFASLYGTLALLPETHRSRVKGVIVNKFRGDRQLFQDGVDAIERLCHTPVLGVLPYLNDLAVPEEDAVALDLQPRRSQGAAADIAVVHLPHISNFTDFDAITADTDIAVRYVQSPADWGDPDLVIIPGTKSTVADLAWLRQQGLAECILQHAANGGHIIGLCGGYQMLGRRIHDPDHVETDESTPTPPQPSPWKGEGEAESAEGLGLLAVETVFSEGKTVRHAHGVGVAGWLEGIAVSGYEIHHGELTLGGDARPLLALADGSSTRYDGAIDPSGRVAGCYLHGLFDTVEAHAALRSLLGMAGPAMSRDGNNVDRLADWLDANVDTGRLMEIIMGERVTESVG